MMTLILLRNIYWYMLSSGTVDLAIDDVGKALYRDYITTQNTEKMTVSTRIAN